MGVRSQSLLRARKVIARRAARAVSAAVNAADTGAVMAVIVAADINSHRENIKTPARKCGCFYIESGLHRLIDTLPYAVLLSVRICHSPFMAGGKFAVPFRNTTSTKG